MIKNLTAVIVGSRSGRHLKTPVPLLPFGPMTVLQRTLTTYLEAGFGEVILVQGHRSGEVLASLGSLTDKVQMVAGSLPDEEYATLLRRGIEHLSPNTRGFAIGLGDQPLLEVSLVKELAERFASTNAKILVPVCQGLLGHPVFFDQSYIAEFKKLPSHGETWDVIKAHAQDVNDYRVYQTAVTRHIEDVDDYHSMLRMAGLPAPEPGAFEIETPHLSENEPAPRVEPAPFQPVARVETNPTD
jgi:molybdenum cofactor cytidylyltransferase